MRVFRVKGPGLVYDLLASVCGGGGFVYLYFNEFGGSGSQGNFFPQVLAVLFVAVSIPSIMNLVVGRRETFVIDDVEIRWRWVFGRWRKVRISEIQFVSISRSADLQGSIEIVTTQGLRLRVPGNFYECKVREVEARLRILGLICDK